MALTAAEIYGFSESLLKSRFDDPQPTPDCHLEFWELCCSKRKHVAIAAPRGHAKSTAITHAYTLANVLFKEACYVIIVSDTEEQAMLFLDDIKTELLENEKLIQLFGVKRLRKDTATDIIVEMHDGHAFRILAKGSEQKIRGRKWRNKRPDLIVCDDLENDEIVMNEERRRKFRRWMNNALIPALAKHGRIRLVGTILHLDSYLERCMPKFEDSYTQSDELRYWSTNPRRVWHSVRYRGHNEDFSALLWPSQWPKERYEEEKARYVDDGDPSGYSQEYLNYPIDEEHAYFQKTDFLPWEYATEVFDPKYPGEYLEYYIGGDLAISKSDQAAYTVFVVVGLNREGQLVVVDVSRFRGDSLEIIEEIFRLTLRYAPILFFLEEENIARSIGPVLYEKMLERQIFVPLSTCTPTQDKEKRAQSIRARMRAGGVRFNYKAHWYTNFMMELITFPRGKYMDQVDAFAHIGLGLAKMVPTYSAKDLADFEYDDEFEDGFSENDGRSAITGY